MLKPSNDEHDTRHVSPKSMSELKLQLLLNIMYEYHRSEN